MGPDDPSRCDGSGTTLGSSIAATGHYRFAGSERANDVPRSTHAES